ncbi:hypothetical protein ACA910_012629 [Epithemia clementina (nom. ined.)]
MSSSSTSEQSSGEIPQSATAATEEEAINPQIPIGDSSVEGTASRSYFHDNDSTVPLSAATTETSNTANNNGDKLVTLVDITDLIESCSSALSMQEPFLCRKETFQLQDAMAATQLMDPKMDSCEIPAYLVLKQRSGAMTTTTTQNDEPNPNNDRRIMFPRPCPESLSDPFVPLPWKDLNFEQASLVVMHQLIRIQALFSGASVGESVFTCLYAHKPILCEMEEYFSDSVSSSLSHDHVAPLLSSMGNLNTADKNGTILDAEGFWSKGCADARFCAQLAVFAATCAMVEITELFRSIVINADIYEEEDFVSNTHDMPFFLIDDKAILRQCLDKTVHILDHWLAAANDSSDEDAKVTRTRNQNIQKLQLSLTFLNGLVLYCSKMGKLRQAGLTETVHSMQRLAISLCKGLQSLSSLATDDKANDPQAPENETAFLDQVFDSYVNRPLVGNTPVRKVSFLSPVESIAKLMEITNELDVAVCGLLLNGTSISRIGRMLRRFCSCNILTRSLIVLNLYFDELMLGQHELHPLIVAHMRELEHVPDDLVQNDHAQAFLSRLAKPIYDTLKLQVSNRNRQRAYMEVAMFQEWTALQNEATLIDNQYRRENEQLYAPEIPSNNTATTPPYFGHFVLSVLLRLMDQHLACGIEVALFCGHDEICSVIWYRDFLLAALIQNLTQMRRGKEVYLQIQAQQQAAVQQQQQQQRVLENSNNRAKGKKKNHHQKNKTSSNNTHHHSNHVHKQQPPAIPKSPSPPPPSIEDIENSFELQVLEVQRMLCRGIVRFIVAMRQSGLLNFPEYEFTSRRTIFEKRFAVFHQSIRHPPPLSFDDYLEGSDGSNISVQDLCQSAAAIFKACRTSVEMILSDIAGQSSHNNNTSTAVARAASAAPPYAPVLESEARAYLKVCVGNSVYLMKLGQLVSATGTTSKKVSVEFDFGAHKEYCIIKLA